MPHATRTGVVLAVTGALLAAACGNGGNGSADDRSDDASRDTPERVAGVNLSRHNVPLEDIHFDTFDGSSVPLSQATESTIERLRDAIPPLTEPPYEPVEGGDWLDDEDVVLGYVDGDGVARAYPHKILNFHEIVNDTLADVPVLVSYCPLCNSGVVFDRRVDDRSLSFGNSSALYENDLVMEDRQTRSYWWQVAGEAIVGDLTGERLEPLPSTTMRWGRWKVLHPNTLVLSRNLGFDRSYDRDPFLGYAERVDDGNTPFPVSDEALDDGRLDPAAQVIGVDVDGVAKAYPIELLGHAAVNDTVGAEPVVIFVDAASGAAAAFRPEARGIELSFEAVPEGRFTDTETESTWDLAGNAISGQLRGERLEGVPSRSTFWFAYIASFPDVELVAPVVDDP